MIKLTKLSNLFYIEYGNQIDLNKLTYDSSGINFISRSSKNLGISAKVRFDKNIKLYPKGSITVALGGSILSSFVQPESFYTGQNIKVLIPKNEIKDIEKYFYCYVITKNRFRYSSHGREANITLDSLLVPDINSIPEWVYNIKTTSISISKDPLNNNKFELNTQKWKEFKIGDLFKITRGKEQIAISQEGEIPLISSTDSNNGVDSYIKEGELLFSKNKLTIANNGSVGACFYQNQDFYATADVSVLEANNLNKYNAFFISSIILQEKYRFNYGRKWGIQRMEESIIKLPIDDNANPDWKFMENYIKTLPFSKHLDI